LRRLNRLKSRAERKVRKVDGSGSLNLILRARQLGSVWVFGSAE